MEKIIINTHEKISIINIDDINYLEAKGAYTIFSLQNGIKVKASKNLNYFNSHIFNPKMLKIERGKVVNLNNLKEICKEKLYCKIVFIDNYDLKISKSVSQRLLKMLEEHFV